MRFVETFMLAWTCKGALVVQGFHWMDTAVCHCHCSVIALLHNITLIICALTSGLSCLVCLDCLAELREGDCIRPACI